MVTEGQIMAGIGDYMQKKIMPKLDDLRKLLLGTTYGVWAVKANAVLKRAAKIPMLSALGVIQENGEIDLETVFEAANAQLKAQGKLSIDIPFMGEFVFGEQDLRDLYQAINGQERKE